MKSKTTLDKPPFWERLKWFIGYNFGIYKLNWKVKEKLGDVRMSDREMWRILLKLKEQNHAETKEGEM